MIGLLSKVGFPPQVESTRMWEARLENAKRHFSPANIGEFDCKCREFSCSLPQWHFEVGLLLLTLSRLTHIILVVAACRRIKRLDGKARTGRTRFTAGKPRFGDQPEPAVTCADVMRHADRRIRAIKCSAGNPGLEISLSLTVRA